MRQEVRPTAQAASDSDPSNHPVVATCPERGSLYALSMEPTPKRLYAVRREIDGKVREEVRLASVNGAALVLPNERDLRRALQYTIMENLDESAGYELSTREYGRVVDKGTMRQLSDDRLRLYHAFDLRILAFGGQYYLCLNRRLVVRVELTLAMLTKRDRTFRLTPEQHVKLKLPEDGRWEDGHWLDQEAGTLNCQITLSDGRKVTVSAARIFPDLTREQVSRLSPALGVSARKLEEIVKQESFLTGARPSRARLDACTESARRLAETVFPITEGEVSIHLDPTPAALRVPTFHVAKDLQDPPVAFDRADRSKRAHDIISGLTRFGAYEKPVSDLRIVLITTKRRRTQMEDLVVRLNKGAFRYPGARKVFGRQLVVRERLVCDHVHEYEDAITRFVRTDARRDADVALVYLPEDGDTTSPDHPYFRVKRLLLHEGLGAQAVDEATVMDPKWRDLNLALNVYAKAGYAPWVLEEALPGADLFIGLSSSRLERDRDIIRMMGYVNVFDSYGRWRFYEGGSSAFLFEDRLRYFSTLVRNSVAAYKANNDGDLCSVHIHLTKSFSGDERKVLAEAVRAASPGASTVFVWVNRDHPLRLYNLDRDDGRIDRGAYLVHDPMRVYLATTGANIHGQTGMGTPIPLELTVWADPLDAAPPIEQVAQQVLSLTRLNWASTHDFSHEPVTTKYAGKIAWLMTRLTEDPSLSLNPILRGVPWFM